MKTATRIRAPSPPDAPVRRQHQPRRRDGNVPEGLRWAVLDRSERKSRAPRVIALVTLVVLIPLLATSAIAPAFSRLVGTAQRYEDQLHLNEPLELPSLQPSSIVAADGSTLERVGFENRQPKPLGEIARSAIRAVLASEDARFYSHGAIDPMAILRAAFTDVTSGRLVEGGSTITQQLVKDLYTGDSPTLTRKIHEAADAIRLEHTYSKSKILDEYMNEVFFGNGAYGIQAAARFYFGVPASRLELPQSALLAGLIQAPTYYDPLTHPNRAQRRRRYVLRRMFQLGWISDRYFRRVSSTPLGLSIDPLPSSPTGPDSYWTQFVIQSFLSNSSFGSTAAARAKLLYGGGLTIYTTLDPSLEEKAQRVLDRDMGGRGMPQSALVTIAPSTGAIEAMAVGNTRYGNGAYNLAVDPGGGRTAGSAFKAFTLATALSEGMSPDRVFNGDSPKTIPNCGGGQTWKLSNAEPGSGDYPLWMATADSVNTVFAQVIDEVGPDNVAATARRMGITSPLDPVCPLTLGTSPVSPLQMTSGYATIDNGGVHCNPYAISKVVAADGQTIFRQRPGCNRAIPGDVAEEETAMLQGVIGFGTGTAANIGRPEAGKTGTGQNFIDAWFIGYVPQLTTGVWVGYAKSEMPMRNVPGYGEGFGGVLAAPMWRDYMVAATRHLEAVGFPKPPRPFGGPFG